MQTKLRLPIITVLVTTITGVASLIATAQPELVTALQRSPQFWEAAHWWRLLTPVLINPEGWRQFAENMAGLAVIGTVVELGLGRCTWLMSYLAGTIVGELTGLAWQPVGGGSSVAICGLLGALMVGLWQRVGTSPARFGAAVMFGMAVLLTCATDVHGPPLLAGAIVGLLTNRKRVNSPRRKGLDRIARF